MDATLQKGRGKAENEPDEFQAREIAALWFDEATYLALNPDVSEAVREGLFKSGEEHYHSFGATESRRTHIEGIIRVRDIDLDLLSASMRGGKMFRTGYNASPKELAYGIRQTAADKSLPLV